ncbi:MAG: cobalamin biosynthesis protein CbiD [Ruminococcaceae bacterium]|nr:cobalamin biosynthesis protein CbiD [Oscillospiraceae bacterium]
MHETGIEGYYAVRDGKKLYYGYTTGTCAAAAAKAAALMLATGQIPLYVDLLTPKGIALSLEVLEPELQPRRARCAIRKYSGDDPDVTDGVLVYADVTLEETPGITVDGGEGVGRVTKPGLKQAIGEAAINPVPKRMIAGALERVSEDYGITAGLKAVISIPAGVELAKRTFNPRLGIVGGISVLGTSGIVEPMSEAALVESIGLELRQKYALGCRRIIIAPGNYGADFIRSLCHVEETELVKCSNFIGQTIDMAVSAGFSELLFVSHIGKFIKLTGGIMNTHSREADARAELMAACALRAGSTAETARRLLDCLTTDEMLEVLRAAGLLEKTMAVAAQRVDYYLNYRAKGQITIGAAVFSNETGMLFTTGPAPEWLAELKANEEKSNENTEERT